LVRNLFNAPIISNSQFGFIMEWLLELGIDVEVLSLLPHFLPMTIVSQAQASIVTQRSALFPDDRRSVRSINQLRLSTMLSKDKLVVNKYFDSTRNLATVATNRVSIVHLLAQQGLDELLSLLLQSSRYQTLVNSQNTQVMLSIGPTRLFFFSLQLQAVILELISISGRANAVDAGSYAFPHSMLRSFVGSCSIIESIGPGLTASVLFGIIACFVFIASVML
jgi:hypothetical protein